MNDNRDNDQAAMPLPTEAAFTQLVAQANNGDQAALAHLRDLLDNHPAIWALTGDLSAHAESLMLRLITGGNVLAAESLRRSIRDMKMQLAGPAPTMLERLAVDRIVACWLQLQYCDTIALAGDGKLALEKYRLQRQDSASKRYHAAIKSLTDLRRLLPRAIDTVRPEPAPVSLRIFTGESDMPDAATA